MPIAGRRSQTSDDARRLVGVVVADDELVPSARGRESRAGAPVDRGDRVAGRVWTRAERRRSRGRADGSPGRRTGGPTSRRRGTSGKVCRSGTILRPALAASQSGAGGGASARQRSLICCSASSRPTARVSARYDARKEQPVSEHRQEERFDVLRDDVVASVQQRPGACRPLEREAAAHRGADRDAFEPRVARTSSTIQRRTRRRGRRPRLPPRAPASSSA